MAESKDTFRQQVIRAARNELRGFAALVAGVVVGGGVFFLTSDWLGESRVLWLTTSFMAGAVAAWALRTWLLLGEH